MNWQSAVERTVAGLGYDLVDTEKSAGGLLRVFIDRLPLDPSAAAADDAASPAPLTAINVDDCERVTRQLQHVLEVEGVAYERLEVSSPGLDRPLRKEADYARFVGEQVEITLNQPFQGRKRYTGELQAGPDGGWRVVLVAKPPKASAVHARSRSKPARATPDAAAEATLISTDAGTAASPLQALDFVLGEVREARLVPVVDFKGRRSEGHGTPAAAVDGVDSPSHDGLMET